MSTDNFTQAVVVIHGIGEQRPMETLRRFTNAIIPDRLDGREKYFSKPDKLSESFELRKLQNVGWRPRTHLYEYYWAYKAEGTAISHVLSWISTLLFRLPRTVPPRLKVVFYLSWILIIVAVLAALLETSGAVSEPKSEFSPINVSIMSTLLFFLLQTFILRFVGDAARYLSPAPQNIKLRQEIRADGIRLLRKLHESDLNYKRIIVVGHSLGSIIAYDVLKHLWQEYHREYQTPMPLPQDALAKVEKLGLELNSNQNVDDDNAQQTAYREAQHELWQELQQLGNPWLVTDFITVGSPLAHASILLGSDEADFRNRQNQRELPTNPPIYEKPESDKVSPRFSFKEWNAFEGDFRLRSIHHAGLFSCTRWTNIFFPAYFGLFGDIVAGPLKQPFGKGILDVPVKAHNPLISYTLLSHTSYWNKKSKQQTVGKPPLALDQLIDALDLRAEHTVVQDDDIETGE